jgi:hypothetical protein
MAPNPRRQDAKLQALYEQIPRIDCQGLCHDSCGPIETSIRERTRIEQESGKQLTCGVKASCTMLDKDRRCSVYAIRPMICRLWGVVESMPCPYGCKPERYLSDAESYRLIAEADLVGGDPGNRAERLTQRLLDEVMGSPNFDQRAKDIARKVQTRPSLAGRSSSLPATVIERPR